MKVRTLVLCDDAWHPAEVVQRGLNALSDPRFSFEFVAHGSRWAPEAMRKFPLVIVAKANHQCATNQSPWLTPETQTDFRYYTQQGGGLLLIHGGCGYKDSPVMRGVTGGAFMSHPDQCAVTFELKPGHPLTNGVEAFTVKDEHYQMVLDAADADVFLYTRSAHGAQPAGWTRNEGGGRVCALTPGHYLEVWLLPSFQNLLRNALLWTAKLN